MDKPNLKPVTPEPPCKPEQPVSTQPERGYLARPPEPVRQPEPISLPAPVVDTAIPKRKAGRPTAPVINTVQAGILKAVFTET